MNTLNICVLNFSGNVGKTTVAAHLLAPRLGAPLISVESVNSDASADGIELERFKGSHYGEVQEALLARDGVVVDVGASNVETFLKMMAGFKGSHDDYDLFVIPVVHQKKQLADTINTMDALTHRGVPPSKLRLVFNMVDPDSDLERDFAPVIVTAQKLDIRSPAAVVHRNEVFEMLKGSGRSLASVMADRTDYREQIRQTSDIPEKHRLIRRLSEQRLAAGCAENLDTAYRTLLA